jgi:error-prone DNA polymerase
MTRAGKFRPIDVQNSDWDCTLEANATGEPEIRLGLRKVGRLVQGRAIAEHRSICGAFAEVDEFARRTHLPKRSVEMLARTGALASTAARRTGVPLAWSVCPAFLPDAPPEKAHSPSRHPPKERGSCPPDGMGLTLQRHPVALFDASSTACESSAPRTCHRPRAD